VFVDQALGKEVEVFVPERRRDMKSSRASPLAFVIQALSSCLNPEAQTRPCPSPLPSVNA
jgi:hypothetical protein